MTEEILGHHKIINATNLDVMRHKLEHHFDEQEALKEALERDEEYEGDTYE